ncbi:PREDICTED: tetratricopeptide repeat protein 27 homolog [Tarenaya hassleriana]|uniref:tetratricopeptide repeat protein 27 homolog n=1 Tax=Tarenaya hassleriana TaxID=28532 RepID=UPI00053C52DE|nr:PREDICTED: tetratricopeptide repeat protein 27 homolog [Tarenaya hassleriana]
MAADQEVQILRGYELRLLRSTVSPPLSDSPSPQSQPLDGSQSQIHPHDSLIRVLLSSIEAGDYLGTLASDAPRMIFGDVEFEIVDSFESADRIYSELLDRVESFVANGSKDDSEKARRVVLVMCIAISAALWFTRCNLTGPAEGLPKCPVPFKVSESKEFVEWENWAKIQLMSVGSDLLGKFSNLQYLVFAKMLLLRMKDLLFETTVVETFGFRSISWWLVRVFLIHQRVLHERSSSLFDLSQVYMAEALDQFGALEEVKSYWLGKLKDDEVSSIVSIVHMEAGVLQYIYGRIDSCRLQLESAGVAAGFKLSLTGALGFRTVHQVEPKAQMVLVANTSSSDGDIMLSSGKSDIGVQKSWGGEVPDIYMTPKLLDKGNEAGKDGAPLKPVEQALVLGQCLLIERGSRQDEMQKWDMAPYIEAIDSQESTYFTLRCFCDLLRIRWESARGRTKGRALEMVEKLVEAINKSDIGAAKRIPLCYAVHFPTIPALRKEYGELLVSCGLVGEAITIFESLELWDNLIYCNCLLGKKAAAVDLIKARLSERPNDPRLWCSLGDVTNNDACYEKALEVSNDKSVRAKRSLARSAYNRGDYEKSKMLWESAMELNSLYPDGWFALGAAALKARDVQKALDAFTFAVQLDPENGEAWNNIACLHMIKKKSKESFIAFKEALKFKRDSWQMWENFSHVAMDVGNIDQALEAVQRILKMSNNKRIDVGLLERIMGELENRNSASRSSASSTDNQVSSDESPETRPYVAAPAETQRQLEVLGKILEQIVRSESTAEIWGLFARWCRNKGELTRCSEALLKQVRSYQGSELWQNRERFRKYAKASLELCRVYMEISVSTRSQQELRSAKMLLQNTIKQAAVNFSDTEEFSDLEACLNEVAQILLENANATT